MIPSPVCSGDILGMTPVLVRLDAWNSWPDRVIYRHGLRRPLELLPPPLSHTLSLAGSLCHSTLSLTLSLSAATVAY